MRLHVVSRQSLQAILAVLVTAAVASGCGALDGKDGDAGTDGTGAADGLPAGVEPGPAQKLVVLTPLTIGYPETVTFDDGGASLSSLHLLSNVVDITGYRSVLFYGLAPTDAAAWPSCTWSNGEKEETRTLLDGYDDRFTVHFGLDAAGMIPTASEVKASEIARVPSDGNFVALGWVEGANGSVSAPVSGDAVDSDGTPMKPFKLKSCSGTIAIKLVGAL